MNTLSFMLYLAGILPGVSFALTLILSLGWIGYLAYSLVARMWGNDIDSWNSAETLKAKARARERQMLPSKGWIAASAISLGVLLLIPPKDTLYFIVASEVGEVVVATPEAKQVISDLQEILKIQLEKAKR